jgi:hypothetical protein
MWNPSGLAASRKTRANSAASGCETAGSWNVGSINKHGNNSMFLSSGRERSACMDGLSARTHSKKPDTGSDQRGGAVLGPK